MRKMWVLFAAAAAAVSGPALAGNRIVCSGDWGSGSYAKSGEFTWSGNRVVAYSYNGGPVSITGSRGLTFHGAQGSTVTLNSVPVAGGTVYARWQGANGNGNADGSFSCR